MQQGHLRLDLAISVSGHVTDRQEGTAVRAALPLSSATPIGSAGGAAIRPVTSANCCRLAFPARRRQPSLRSACWQPGSAVYRNSMNSTAPGPNATSTRPGLS
jgi:hypothetical protein